MAPLRTGCLPVRRGAMPVVALGDMLRACKPGLDGGPMAFQAIELHASPVGRWATARAPLVRCARRRSFGAAGRPGLAGVLGGTYQWWGLPRGGPGLNWGVGGGPPRRPGRRAWAVRWGLGGAALPPLLPPAGARNVEAKWAFVNWGGLRRGCRGTRVGPLHDAFRSSALGAAVGCGRRRVTSSWVVRVRGRAWDDSGSKVARGASTCWRSKPHPPCTAEPCTHPAWPGAPGAA